MGLLVAALVLLLSLHDKWTDAYAAHQQRLPAVATARAAQVGNWAAQVRRQTAYLQSSARLREVVELQLNQPTPQRLEGLMRELQALTRSQGLESPTLIGGQGQPLWNHPPAKASCVALGFLR